MQKKQALSGKHDGYAGHRVKSANRSRSRLERGLKKAMLRPLPLRGCHTAIVGAWGMVNVYVGYHPQPSKIYMITASLVKLSHALRIWYIESRHHWCHRVLPRELKSFSKPWLLLLHEASLRYSN
jgi:hypothetical protein